MQNVIQEDINNFIKSFYGYGNLNSDHWFIGMEEGGGETLDEIQSRLQVWKELGEATLVDVVDFHHRIKNDKGKNFSFLFREGNPHNQRTWRSLIKLLLAYKEGGYSLKDVKKTQSRDWGRLSSDNCLLELFPLPSLLANAWKYKDWFNDDNLKSRAIYKRTCESHRIEGIRSLISAHRPKLIVFYGKGYGEKYRAIVVTYPQFRRD